MKESVGSAQIPVLRRNGADGEVSVGWRTIDKSAHDGQDFQGGEGVLVFKHAEVHSPFNSTCSISSGKLYISSST